MWKFVLLSGLVACKTAEIPTPPPLGGTADTAPPPPPEITLVTFVVSGFEDQPTAIAIRRTDGTVVDSRVVEQSEVAFELGERPESEASGYISFGGDARYKSGFYPVTLHLDDGDSEPEPGEVIVSQDADLIYIFDDGTDPAELHALGLDFGWSDFFASDPKLGGIPMLVRPPSAEATISGTVASPVRVVSLADAQLDAPKFDVAPVIDQELSGDWTITMSGKVPEGYPPAEERWPAEGALLRLRAYEDVDASGSFTDGDELGQPLFDCSGFSPQAVQIGYLPPSDSLLFAVLDSNGLRGWNVLTQGSFETSRPQAVGAAVDGVVVGPCP